MTEDNNQLPAPTTEFLLFQEESGQFRVQVRLQDGSAWLTQRDMASLYQIAVPTVNHHISEIYDDGEVLPEATIRKYLIVQTEGARTVRRLVDHYSLEAVLSVGYRVRSPRGVQFRQWATSRLREYLQKGFVMDDERLKNPGGFGPDFFDELLERIRAIRASERRFYQKITDIYAQCSIDYDPQAEISKTFFATVQNKLHWAIHGNTAAELISRRAKSSERNMGLTTWKTAPQGNIRKGDVETAKNYLTEEEVGELNRIVTMYLDFAEDQARRRKTMAMADWVQKLDSFLEFNERNVLQHAGTISHTLAVERAHCEYQKFDAARKHLEATTPVSDFDKAVEAVKKLKSKSPGDNK